MAAIDLDVVQLSSFCSVPQTSITTLLDAPTKELVHTLLANISAKALEHNELKSQSLKLNIELENAVRGGETKSRVLKASIGKGLKEAAELRQKLEVEEKKQSATESELEALKASTASSASELSDAKARINSLETFHRDTLSLLESKSTAYDKLTEEVAAQHQKTVELRREVSNLEQSIQAANATSSNAKYHEQALMQEIEQLKRNNEWLDNELKTKSADYTKYRKEKGLRLAELQRQNDEATSTIGSLNRTVDTLRKRLGEVGQKADDAFSQTQKMQEEASRREEAFKIELDTANRLAELMKNATNTEKERQKDLHDQMETFKEEALEEIGRISAEVDTEHREKEAAEQRVVELEVQVERLEADIAKVQDQTPQHEASHQGVNGHALGTPVRSGSAHGAFSPSPTPFKGGISLTQMYSDYSNLKRDLDAERRRNEKLSSTIDDMIQDLENREPEVKELHVDHERLESHIAEMSSLLDTVGKERDLAIKNARKQEGQVEAKIKEGEVLRQQLRDLSSQVKILLMEVHLRDQGVEELGVERHRQLERLARGDLNDESRDGVTDTNIFISEHLVTFKNVAQLQEQNTNLIKLTRELGERMEREEASRAMLDQEDMQQKYELCKDEVKSLVTQSQSYIRERDMFRRMLSHRGQLPPDTDLASMFGESVLGGPPATPTRNTLINSIEQSPTSREFSDYAKLLKDMQSHFDSYRQEAATDRSTLKQQVDSLSRTNSELRNEVARNSSQVTLAHERYEMLQANYAMLTTENEELQKRSQFFSNNAAKQELKTQQVVEDLVESKGLADSIRTELAILKAEKDFWKSVEKRITEDNTTLSYERDRLNSLSASLQSLLNENEHSSEETRRRLLTQVESLEKDLQAANRKLSDEIEENKRATLRREFEQQQNQKRIDDLITSLGALREDFVAVKITRDHLQARVDELSIELKSAEERILLLQPSSARQPPASNGQGSVESFADEESNLTKEQELGLQVSELRRDLELSKGEVENAHSQIEQYKAISQSSEERLQSLNETQDLFRQEMDQALEEKGTKIHDLQSRVDDLASELTSTAAKLSTLQTKEAENGRRAEEQKNVYELELAQLKDQADRHSVAAQYLQEDLKAQAEIAQQAQQNYENELVKHAEAAKALQSVRAQYNDLKVKIVELKTEAESARASLVQNEESWAESKDRYERELDQVRQGKQNLTIQNNRLHQQLENVSSQISNLQKRNSAGENDNSHDSSSTPNENLQEVIKYLRREKEIVDVQLELSTQEAKRLKQQLDYTQSQLDDTRLKLNQQRHLEEDNERAAFNHKKLMDTINELNTFRESSVTLRNETRQAQASLAAKVKQIEELGAQVEPLQAEIRELRNERETQAGEMKLLQENCDRWQQRAQNILQKYDRVDPAELETLKGHVQSLETECDDLRASKQGLQEQVDSIPSKITLAQEQGNEKVEELRQRLTEQFKTRSKNLSAIIKEKEAALQNASREKSDLEQRFEMLHSELKEAEVQRDQAFDKASTLQVNPTDSKEQNGSEEGQVDEQAIAHPTSQEVQALQEKLSAAEARANEDASRISSLQNEVAAAQTKITDLEHHIIQIQQNMDEAITELDRLQGTQQQQSTSSINSVSVEQMERLREELVQVQQEAENLRANASINASFANAPGEDGSKSVAEQVNEHVETIRVNLDARHNERVAQLEENFKKRSDAMKAQLTKKLAEGKQALAAENEQALENLKSAHLEELEKLKVHHQHEIDKLRRDEDSRFETFKDKWLADHPAPVESGGVVEKPESQATRSPLNPTDEEARELCAKNAIVRGILSRNITSKVQEAKEKLAKQLKEEHEKQLNEQLAEVREKASTAQGHAVFMEGKRSALKLSMAENKAKQLQPRLDIVQKAAQETPQKPVGEVWAIAKEAKPVAPASQTPQQDALKKLNPRPAGTFGQPAPSSSNNSENLRRTSTFGQPTPSTSSQQVNSPSNRQTVSQSGVFGQPTPLVSNQRPNNPLTAQNGPSTGTFGNPTPMNPSHQVNPFMNQNTSQTGNFSQPARTAPGQQANSSQSWGKPPSTPPRGQAPPLAQQQPQNQIPISSSVPPGDMEQPQETSIQAPPVAQAVTSTTGIPPPFQPLSASQGNLPAKPPQGTSGQYTNQGAGSGPPRGLQQSGLPVARGSSTRGGGRARGQGFGRGAIPTVDTSRGQGLPHGRGSPTSGQLNSGARQFVPQGNKRPRDDAGQDGQQGGEGNIGKRIRGGGGIS